MTALKQTATPHRIYRFGLFIEKTVIFVVLLGIGILLSSYFLPLEIPNRDFLFLLSGAIAIYTLLYHHFVYFKNPTTAVAFIDNLVYSTFIFILNLVTGGLHSPLFFLYLLPIISVRLNLGTKLPMAITFYVAALIFLELILQTNPDVSTIHTLIGSFAESDIYAAATYIISILLVGLYIRAMSIELTTEHEQTAEVERLNAELKRIDRGKDEFIQVASHEIRTPLTAVRGGLSLLLSGSVGKLSPDQHKFVEKILNSANRLSDIAEDSLNISALEKHSFTLKLAPFDLGKLAEKVIAETSTEALSKKVAIKLVKPDADLPQALGDEKRIETVLSNILDNAIKFTPSGGTVTVRITHHGSKLITSVSDTGVGIPDEEVRNLFRKFYRVENVLNESTQGTGLGLYIVRLIMNLHGETVGVESELGHGSTFTFTLKAVQNG